MGEPRCNHCRQDFVTKLADCHICVPCFIAGHRFNDCGPHCKTERERVDPRVSQALAALYANKK